MKTRPGVPYPLGAVWNGEGVNFALACEHATGVELCLLGGQDGNNNAYCQDNEISWLDWEKADRSLLEFTRRLIAFHRGHPVFRRRRWFQGRPLYGTGVSDIGWFKPNGDEMSDEDWNNGFAKSLGVYLNGEAIPSPDAMGNRIIDQSFYLLFNAHHEPIAFTLPARNWGKSWLLVLDTNAEPSWQNGQTYRTGRQFEVAARSVVVLCRVN